MNEILGQYGLAGLVITVLSGVIVVMARYIIALQKKYDDLLEKRGDEHKEALLALSAPIERLANFSEFTTSKVNKRGR